MLHSKKQKKVTTKRKINKMLKPKLSKVSSIKASLQESEKSKCRLKAAWADIIKRYQNISAEETDVIDLVTEEIVVNRGILQKETKRYVGALNLHASKPLEDAIDDDDSIWHLDPNLCENDAGFNQRVSLRKCINKTNDKTNDILEILLEASNESFDWETESSDEYNEFNENLRDINEPFDEILNTEEESEIYGNNDSSSENESLKTTNGQSNSITLTEIPSSQSTESITQSNSSRRLRVYSFNTFDSGHESESEDTDSDCSDSGICLLDIEFGGEKSSDSNSDEIYAQEKNLDYTRQTQQETLEHCQVTQRETLNYCRQQETVNCYQVTQRETLNYCKVQSIDYPQRETLELIQKIPPITLTQEQKRLWLEPTSEDYTQLLTWTNNHVESHSLLN